MKMKLATNQKLDYVAPHIYLTDMETDSLLVLSIGEQVELPVYDSEEEIDAEYALGRMYLIEE